jgi:hypothetical protein
MANREPSPSSPGLKLDIRAEFARINRDRAEAEICPWQWPSPSTNHKVSVPRFNPMRLWIAQVVWLSVLCSASCCPASPAVALAASAGGGNGGGLGGTIPATEWCQMRARPKANMASVVTRVQLRAASVHKYGTAPLDLPAPLPPLSAIFVASALPLPDLLRHQ